MRLFRSIYVCLFVAALLTSTSPAQIGIYGKFEATHSSSSSTITPTAWFKGPAAGIYYDFIHLGPASIGIDLRGNLLYGDSNQKFRSGLAGLRLAVKAPLLPLRPYIQGDVGIGSITSGNLGGVGVHYNNKFEYQILGGVDIPIVPHLEWRAIEIGYGRVSAVSSFASTPSLSLFSIGTGLVLRLR
jgi:hypothetical protein